MYLWKGLQIILSNVSCLVSNLTNIKMVLDNDHHYVCWNFKCCTQPCFYPQRLIGGVLMIDVKEFSMVLFK